MIEISNKIDCCGCWACENICPKSCISMVEDEEGFRYPQVDKDVCIDCHLCEKVCPVANAKADEKHRQRAFLLQHRNEKVLHESASGGAFTAIASYVIERDGVAFGAAYDKDFQVTHQYAENVDELRKFRNSKYVQSYVGKAYQEAKEFLKQGRMVCFSGTPCQLEGLLKYLRKPYDRLITVDVMCHSITSPKIFRMYVDMQKEKYGDDIENIMFRDKQPYGYKYSLMSVYRGGKQIYKEGVETDIYLRSFFCDVNVRPSCYDCKFKKQHHLTDFTIWDCFDVRKFSKKFDNDKGVTRILANTDKANQILSEMNQVARILEIPVGEAVSGVKEMLYSVNMNPRREAFFKECAGDFLGGGKILQKYFPVSTRAILEKNFRVVCCKLGVYSLIKRFAKSIIKELKRS